MRGWMLLLGFAAVIGLVGCGDDVTEILSPEDLEPPLGLQSVTGDQNVTLFWWCSNYDDLVGFKVYMATGATTNLNPREEIPAGFTVVDSIEVDAPCSSQKSMVIDGLANGSTYSFLVVAVKNDDWNEISHTSNIVVDTPRPETAATVTLHAKQEDAALAGFELGNFSIVSCAGLDDNYTTLSGLGDIMVEKFNPGAGLRLWLDGINEAWIQDLGYMADWDLADVPPQDGYADTGHSVEALLGHVYAVWTGDAHFAKVQVTDLNTPVGWLKVKAAYQPKSNEPEYK